MPEYFVKECYSESALQNTLNEFATVWTPQFIIPKENKYVVVFIRYQLIEGEV